MTLIAMEPQSAGRCFVPVTIVLLTTLLLAVLFAAYRWRIAAGRRQKRAERKVRQQEEVAAWERMLEQRRQSDAKSAAGDTGPGRQRNFQ